MHALVLILVVLFAGPLVAQIPLAALAGVLMVTAVRMVEIHNVRAVLRSTRSDALVLVAHRRGHRRVRSHRRGRDRRRGRRRARPARGVADRRRQSQSRVPAAEIDSTTEAELLHEHIVTYRLDGALFFGAAQRFLTELTAVSDVRVVILRLPQLQVLDATGAQALGEIVAELEGRGITVLLKGPSADTSRSCAPSVLSTGLPTRTMCSRISTTQWRTLVSTSPVSPIRRLRARRTSGQDRSPKSTPQTLARTCSRSS